jgi:hypothetical protein
VSERRAELPGSGRRWDQESPSRGVVIEIQQKIAGLLPVQGLSGSAGRVQASPGTRASSARYDSKAFARYDKAAPIQAGITGDLQWLVRIHYEDVTSGDLDTASSVFADDCENATPLRGQREASAGRWDQASPPPTASTGTASRSSPSSEPCPPSPPPPALSHTPVSAPATNVVAADIARLRSVCQRLLRGRPRPDPDNLRASNNVVSTGISRA